MDQLYLNTISEDMSSILDQLMKENIFNAYVLVGGTALSLQLGHRKSIDLDLFTTKNYDPNSIKKKIQELYPDSSTIYERINSVGFNVENIKVEFVQWKEGFELDYIKSNQWRLLKKEIIAVMKLNAIQGRNEKKDYADLSFILKNRSLNDILLDYKKYYPYQQVRPVLEKLTGNLDLIDQPDPVFLSQVSWEDIEYSIKKELKSYYEQLKSAKINKSEDIMDKVQKYKKDQGKGLSM